MALTDDGAILIAARLVGTSLPAIDATNGYVGIGDSSTAFAKTQTDLQAATNKMRELIDAAPGLASNVITLVTTFESGDANWVWNEYAVFNHATAGRMLCRKVAALGTKVSGTVWELTLTLTLAA